METYSQMKIGKQAFSTFIHTVICLSFFKTYLSLKTQHLLPIFYPSVYLLSQLPVIKVIRILSRINIWCKFQKSLDLKSKFGISDNLICDTF